MGTFVFTQTTAATTWNVTHNLNNQYPSIDILINSNGTLQKGLPLNLVVNDANTLTITFTDPQSGQARIIA